VFQYLYIFFEALDVLKTKFIEDELGTLAQHRVGWLLLQIRRFENNPKLIDPLLKLRF
jgi:hypothetical protein